MTRTPPPPPKPKRFRNAGARSSTPLSPTVAVAARRGLGLGGQPRQTAPRRPRPAPRRTGNGRGGIDNGTRRRRSFSADADSSGFIPFRTGAADGEDGDGSDDDDEDDEDGDNGGGGGQVVDLTHSPVGNRRDRPIELSDNSDSSSAFDEDEEAEQQQESRARQARQATSPLTFDERLAAEPHTPENPRAPYRRGEASRTPGSSRRSESRSPQVSRPDDVPEEEDFDDLYDATPQPRSLNPYYYPPVNSPDFSREADEQLRREFQQSIRSPELSPGIIYSPPGDVSGHDNDELSGGAFGEPSPVTQHRRRSAGPPPRSNRRNGRFLSAPPIMSTRRNQRGHSDEVDGVDSTASRSTRDVNPAGGNGQQRGPDRQQRRSTESLPDYQDDSPPPKPPVVKKLDDCERDREELNQALHQAQLDVHAREVEISRLQGEVEELPRQNDALRGTDSAGSPEIVQGVRPEDVFFDEPDEDYDVNELEDALDECHRKRDHLQRLADKWKALGKRAVAVFNNVVQQVHDRDTTIVSQQVEIAGLEAARTHLMQQLTRTVYTLAHTQHENGDLQQYFAEKEQELKRMREQVDALLKGQETGAQHVPGDGWILEDDCDEKRRDDRDEIAALQERIEQLEADLERANREDNEVIGELAENATLLVELRQQLEDNQRGQPEQPQDEARGDGWITEEECDQKYQDAIDNLKQELADLTDEHDLAFATLEARLMEAEAERDVALTDFEDRVQAEDDLMTQINELQAEIARLKSQLSVQAQQPGTGNESTSDADSEALRKELQELQKQYDDIKKRLEDCEKHRSTTDDLEERLRQQFIDMQTQMQSIIDELTAQLQSCENASTSKKRKRGSADSQSSEEVRAELEARIESLDDEVKRLKADLEDCRKHRRELEHGLLEADGKADDDEEEDDDHGPTDDPPAGRRGGGSGGGGKRRREGRGGRGGGSAPVVVEIRLPRNLPPSLPPNPK